MRSNRLYIIIDQQLRNSVCQFPYRHNVQILQHSVCHFNSRDVFSCKRLLFKTWKNKDICRHLGNFGHNYLQSIRSSIKNWRLKESLDSRFVSVVHIFAGWWFSTWFSGLNQVKVQAIAYCNDGGDKYMVFHSVAGVYYNKWIIYRILIICMAKSFVCSSFAEHE